MRICIGKGDQESRRVGIRDGQLFFFFFGIDILTWQTTSGTGVVCSICNNSCTNIFFIN